MPRLVIAICAILVGFAATNLPAQDTTVTPVGVSIEDGTIVLRDANGHLELTLDARLQADVVFYVGRDAPFGSGTSIRRARLGFESKIARTWEAAFDVDFADASVEIKDAWIGYAGMQNTLIRAGQFKEPFSLQTLTSSKDIMFMERAAIDALSPDRNVGVGLSRWGKSWQASVGVFGESAADADDENDEAFAVTGRITLAPVNSARSLVHLGFSGSRRNPRTQGEAGRSVAVEGPVEIGVAGGPLLESGVIDGVDHLSLLNGEVALLFGRASMHAEYTRMEIARERDQRITTDGGYVSGSVFVSDDQRAYLAADGEFDRVRPRRSGGAWELVARFSWFDMRNADAGSATQVTGGVTWHINTNVRWMVNATHVSAGQRLGPDAREIESRRRFLAVQTRMALAF